MTYRYGGQYEGDTQTYKPPFEVERWRAKDPLDFFRRATVGHLDAAQLDAIDAEVQAEVEAAFVAAAAADWPSTDDMAADVYTTWPEGAR